MNTSVIAGITRAVVAALAGFAAGKGLDITGLGSPEVVNGIAVVAVAIWSVFAKKTPTA